MTEPDTLLAGLLDGYIARDAGAMGAVLADDVRVWVTNAEGGVGSAPGTELVVGALLSLEAPVFHIVTQSVPCPGVAWWRSVPSGTARACTTSRRSSPHHADRTPLDGEALPAYSAEF